MDGKQLKAAFRQLPPLVPQNMWDKHRLAIRNHVVHSDLTTFLLWSTIQATMFVADAYYVLYEMDKLLLRNDPNRQRWIDAIREVDFGKPMRMPGHEYTSGNLIHQTYHIKQWMDEFGDVTDLTHIVEFGGGYGAMCAICRRLGFTGKYTIVDFPELLLLQKYYLSNIGMEVECRSYDSLTNPGVVENVDLVIGCYSLSEAPVGTRNRFLELFPSNSYLFAYQQEWDGVNNRLFFDEFMKENSLQWISYEHPYFDTHWYTLGKKSLI